MTGVLASGAAIRPFRREDTEAVVALWRRAGLVVPWNDPYRDIERKLTVQPELFLVVEDAASGDIVGAFACGTAAVITPIGRLLAEDFEIVHPGSGASELALSLREELTGIQYGRVEDRHGWLTRLDA